MKSKPGITAGLTAAAVFALLVTSAQAQQQKRGPLVLAKSTYFYVGGKIDEHG